MARLKNNKYTRITLNSIENPLLIVVDMINGFINQGSMSDSYIKNIIGEIKQLLDFKIDPYFIRDVHKADAIEFKSFPSHCLYDDIESEIVDELTQYNTKYPTVYKNCTNAFLASNNESTNNNFNLDIINKYDTIIITGCCSDICVMQLALSLKTYFNQYNIDKRIIIPVNCIETYDIKDIHDAFLYNEMSINLMQQAGIDIVKEII